MKLWREDKTWSPFDSRSSEMFRACIQLALEHVQVCSNNFKHIFAKPFKLICNWDAKPHCGWRVLLHWIICCPCSTVAMIALVAKPFAIASCYNGFRRLASRKAPRNRRRNHKKFACWRSEKVAIVFESSSLSLNIVWFYTMLLMILLFLFVFGSRICAFHFVVL